MGHELYNDRKAMSKPETYELDSVRNLFTLPDGLKGPLSINDLKIIERKCSLNIVLYSQSFTDKARDTVLNALNRSEESLNRIYSLKLIRGGTRPDLPIEDHVYLCLLGDQHDHVCFIRNIQDFIKVILSKSNKYTKNFKKSAGDGEGGWCIKCFMFNHTKVAWDEHWNVCKHTEAKPAIKMPNPGDSYKFTRFDATMKNQYIAFFDTEAFVKPTQDKYILQKHSIAACDFAIMD